MKDFIKRTDTSLESYEKQVDLLISNCRYMGILSKKKLEEKYKEFTPYLLMALKNYKNGKNEFKFGYRYQFDNWYNDLVASISYTIEKATEISVEMQKNPKWKTNKMNLEVLQIRSVIRNQQLLFDKILDDFQISYQNEILRIEEERRNRKNRVRRKKSDEGSNDTFE